jgi:GNAT superfamily N-acetyltransferase
MQKTDCDAVFQLIRELAQYEKLPHEVEIDAIQLEKDGFGATPLYGAIVAEFDGRIIGLALYYFRYSTWKGKRLYLEDLIVKEEYRRMGVGKSLFEKTMELSLSLGCNGMTWAVLDWNEPAIQFYKKFNSNFDSTWILTNLSRKQIETYFNPANN